MRLTFEHHCRIKLLGAVTKTRARKMIDIHELPVELRECIWTEYRNGVRDRLPILTFIHALYQDGASTVLDWMAHMLQYPVVKPGKVMVLIGQEGCSKNAFAELLRLLLGRDQVVQTNTLDEFNENLDGVTLVHLDNVNLREELPTIKDLVTSNQILINRTPQHVYVIPSYHRVLLTTDALSPLLQHSTTFHRRFTVVACGTMNVPEFLNAIHAPARLAAFREHLMNRWVSPQWCRRG